MENPLFNNFTLSDPEVEKIIINFKEIIKSKSIILGKYSEDCCQEIKYSIYKALTKNRSDKNKKT